MATSYNDQRELRHAILRVWNPLEGAWSLSDVISMYIQRYTCPQRQEKRSEWLKSAADFPNFHCLRDRALGIPFAIEKTILSSSWSEGLYLYGQLSIEIPDIDIMYVLKDITFTKQDQLDGNLLVREDTPFIDAYLTEETDIKTWDEFLEESSYPAKKRRLSSMKMKQELLDFMKMPFLNGFEKEDLDNMEQKAAFSTSKTDISSDYYISFFKLISPLLSPIPALVIKRTSKVVEVCKSGKDIVLSISCEGWPLCANEWITRERIWPAQDLIKTITQAGFHIVPKSSSSGNFRLSFSCAETTLITNLSSLQHKVLQSFKAVVKHHQGNWSKNIKEIISTYHLKTVAFWYFESSALESWTEETVEMHLVALLENLAQALDKRHLPMYFMPKVNLFPEVSKYEEVKGIVEKILQLSESFSAIKNAVDELNAYPEVLDFFKTVQDPSWLNPFKTIHNLIWNFCEDEEACRVQIDADESISLD